MFKKNIQKFIKGITLYKFTLIASLSCFLILLYPIDFNLGIPSLPILLNVISIFIILNLLSKTKYTSVFVVLLSIIVSFNVFFSLIYSSWIEIGIMASIMETNTMEAESVLKGAFVHVVIVFVSTTFLLFQARKELKNLNLSRRNSILILFVYCFLFLPLISYRRLSIKDNVSDLRNQPFFTVQSLLNTYAPLLYGNIACFVAYEYEMYNFRKFASLEKSIPDGIVLIDSLTSKSARVTKVYVVIGESSLRTRYSLYGYDKPTTPMLDSLSREGSVNLKYYDAISGAPFTRDGVPMILSFSSPNDRELIYKEKNLIDLANLAGYETYWISSQAKLGGIDTYISLMSTSANWSSFASTQSNADDLFLIPVLDKIHRKGDELQFFVLHLNGNHREYIDRYDAVDKEALPGEDSSDLEYDRSIHHTDRVLFEIYNIMKDDGSSILFYLPDHGEEVGFGHGFVYKGKDQFRIPLITIDNAGVSLDSITKKYIEPELNMINSTSSIYILLEAIGYHIPQSYTDKALEDSRYILHGDGKVYLYKDTKD